MSSHATLCVAYTRLAAGRHEDSVAVDWDCGCFPHVGADFLQRFGRRQLGAAAVVVVVVVVPAEAFLLVLLWLSLWLLCGSATPSFDTQPRICYAHDNQPRPPCTNHQRQRHQLTGKGAVVAVGCNGGHHRSVVLAEVFADWVSRILGWNVQRAHLGLAPDMGPLAL